MFQNEHVQQVQLRNMVDISREEKHVANAGNNSMSASLGDRRNVIAIVTKGVAIPSVFYNHYLPLLSRS